MRRCFREPPYACLDGGQHSVDEEIAKDRARAHDLEQRGYLVLRFWNQEVIENLEGVCETILNAAEGKG